MLRTTCRAALCVLGSVVLVSPASAQLIGTFTWQLQPYCNVLTLNVSLTGSVFTLDGYDDQCGTTTRAPAAGVAFENPDGTVGLGVAIVLSPGAAPIHVSATIAQPTLSGPWRDSSGNIGTLTFNPIVAFGAERPAPRPVFVAGLSAGGGRITDVDAPVNPTDAATKGYADSLVADLALPPASKFIFQPDGGFAALSTFGTGTIPVGGTGSRLLWHPAKAALRAGRVTALQWSEFAIGTHSVAFGLDTRATADASTAMGDGTRAIGPASTAMGLDTLASGSSSTAMGNLTTASGFRSTAMGGSTTASGQNSTALGFNTTASGLNSVAMGGATVSSGLNSSLATGIQTVASGEASTAMGFNTMASGDLSITMGANTIASGRNSMAMGFNATAGHESSFVYGDGSASNHVTTTDDNQFIVRATRGVRFFTNSTHTSGVQLTAGASAWTSLSDVNRKHLFRDLDGEAVLAKLAAMPIREWSYKAQDTAIRHVGPTAQDFYAAFGLGEDPLGISTIDADGIALRAIQALEARTAALEAENRMLRSQLDALRTAIATTIGREP